MSTEEQLEIAVEMYRSAAEFDRQAQEIRDQLERLEANCCRAIEADEKADELLRKTDRKQRDVKTVKAPAASQTETVQGCRLDLVEKVCQATGADPAEVKMALRRRGVCVE